MVSSSSLSSGRRDGTRGSGRRSAQRSMVSADSIVVGGIFPSFIGLGASSSKFTCGPPHERQ